MSSKKRGSEATAPVASQRKRVKLSDTPEEGKQAPSVLRPEEVDFPRGGGSSFTPVEYKAIRAEALKELNDEDVFQDSGARNKGTRKGKKKANVGPTKKSSAMQQTSKGTTVRVEQLNYKRIATGMKLLCQIVAVYPFILIVSLPNQLLGHIPITHISSHLTSVLEAADADDSEDEEPDSEDRDESKSEHGPSDLTELFCPGQYVRAVVSAVKPPGTTEGRTSTYLKDEVEKASRRVELSLNPELINAGLVKTDLKKGFTVCAAVQSVEDHGYILDFGLAGSSGFMRYRRQSNEKIERKRVGSLVNVIVDKLAEDGRTCIFTANEAEFKSSILKEVSNVSSILPGVLVQALVTSVVPSGLVVQLLGSFEGTIDMYHMASGLSQSDFKVGKKVKARILYDVVGTSPPQFALSLKEHVVSLDVKKRKMEDGQTIQESFPIGTILQTVKVKRVEPERGLIVSVEDGVDGFVHISHTSDEHVPSLSANSGPWKLDSVHRARIVGFHPLDGILQLSFRPSILTQKFLRVDDVNVGEVIKGTIKKLTDSCLFVSINGNVDAMVWPNHYADIMLKHPQKRFKFGASVKCRVLAVDPNRRRILLTAKKTLVESDMPIVSSLDDVEAGLVTHGVVCKVLDKILIVEFYNNVRAIVPTREVSEEPVTNLVESFSVGKPVKVRVLSVDRETSRIIASIRQASGDLKSTIGDIKSVEIGQTVFGTVLEIHRDNALLILEPSRVRALISLHNVANHRGTPADQLRSSLKSGDIMEELVVVTRNLDKGIVIVANRPSPKAQSSKQALNLDDISIGSKVIGRVLKHGRHGAIVKFPGWVTGSLHPTDTTDDFEQGNAFPAINSMVTATVIAVDYAKKHLILSTRCSRSEPSSKPKIVDREVGDLKDLKVGDKIRGFTKSVAEHGVFVTVGRGIDARVQIKELYDEYVKDWKSGFEANQLVSGRILSINPNKNQIEMTFRSVSGSPSAKAGISIGDLVEGQKVDGKVKKVEDFGIFITIDDTRLTGLCHKSEIADNKDADVTMALRNFREGDMVKAIVLAVDNERRRISLGLKPSYFSKEDLQSSDETEEQADDDLEEDSPMLDNAAPSSDVEASDNMDDASQDEDDTAMVVDSSVFELQSAPIPESPRAKSFTSVPVLSLQGGFQWTSEVTPVEDNIFSSDDESDAQTEKKRKRRKKGIEQDLTADMHTRKPESVADFERHLLGSPSSSYIWIQYMSFQLQLAEIDKAREIGKRALQAISIREEQEKLNVWIALLNLENTYGTDESLEALFKDAARYNDSKTMYLRMAAIFDQSDKAEKAEEQYKRTCKKFGHSSKAWTLFGEHYLRRGLMEEARKLLPRSLQSLEKRKHLKTISKFAQLEYKLGDPERGKTIFEGIVDSHPKRWDLWSIYMDMEAGQKDVQSIRNLFDRVLTQKMTSHKAKTFFKKWLELERRIGDEAGERIVKEKAIEWTQRTA
ncbi:hypothetical protein DFH11DRAFT_1557375 [Phellopilus nigrolimitatus]|nr:hypothetical protein DFH11DRAFT_1557375 [Phellopilus nigrolimitatus]